MWSGEQVGGEGEIRMIFETVMKLMIQGKVKLRLGGFLLDGKFF